MAYTLKLTNGKILLTLPDQQYDSITTSLTLIGKNVNAYGTDINQNYIRILENFSNSSAPRAPLVGQIWYDYAEQRLKVYTNNLEWKPIGGPTISPVQPQTLVPGDLWFDESAQQLKFTDRNGNLITIGPATDASVGKNGWVIENYLDISGNTQTVVSLYANDGLIGIVTSNSFTLPASTLTSFTNVSPGITLNEVGDNPPEFYGVATSARQIYKSLTGEFVTADDFLTNSSPWVWLDYPLILNNDTQSLRLGIYKDMQMYVTDVYGDGHRIANLFISGDADNPAGYLTDFSLKVNNYKTTEPVMYVNATSATIGIFTSTPVTSYMFPDAVGSSFSNQPVSMDVFGNVIVRGNLVVQGGTTTISSQDLVVYDANIELARRSVSVIDADVSGQGGIRLNGTRQKSILWYDSGSPGVGAWTFTEDIDIKIISASSSTVSTLRIDSQGVLTKDTLLPSVKYAPGLVEVGNLNSATIGILKVNTYTSAAGVVTGSIGVSSFGQVIELGDINTAYISAAGKKIYNVGTPAATDPDSSAATKQYVDDAISISRNLKAITTIDVSGIGNNPEDPNLDNFVIQMLGYLLPPDALPPYDTPENTVARIMVVRYTTPEIANVPSNYMDPGLPLTVDKGGVQDSAQVIEWNQYLRVTTNLPAYPLGVNRAIKQYLFTGGVWTRYIVSGSSNTIWSDGTW